MENYSAHDLRDSKGTEEGLRWAGTPLTCRHQHTRLQPQHAHGSGRPGRGATSRAPGRQSHGRHREAVRGPRGGFSPGLELRKEREVSVGGEGRSRRRREGTLVPHDRMQGGGTAPHWVYVRKALYPPVLTPRGTVRLREGKCEGKMQRRPPPRPALRPPARASPSPSHHPPLMWEERRADALPPHRRAAGKEGRRCLRGPYIAPAAPARSARSRRRWNRRGGGANGMGAAAYWSSRSTWLEAAFRLSPDGQRGVRAGLGAAAAGGGPQAPQSGAGEGLRGFCWDMAAQLYPDDSCTGPEVFNVQTFGVKYQLHRGFEELNTADLCLNSHLSPSLGDLGFVCKAGKASPKAVLIPCWRPAGEHAWAAGTGPAGPTHCRLHTAHATNLRCTAWPRKC